MAINGLSSASASIPRRSLFFLFSATFTITLSSGPWDIALMMQRARLFLVTAILEAVTGLSLLVLPSLPLRLLLSVDQAAPEALFIARLAGAALLAIGIICYFARNDQHSPAQHGVLIGILFYNLTAAAILACAGISLEMHGILLWPAVVLHVVLALWCVACLRLSLSMK